MHDIKLIKIIFTNILSYGNNINEVNFSDGLTWIKGGNGTGKSTIIEALTYALFGKAYRGISLDQLCNALNKSKLSVDLYFERSDAHGTTHYRILRTLTKSGSKSFAIYKDHSDKPLPKSAGVSQKVFEDEVLGFNQILFQNIISMNTIQTVPFLDMVPKAKRQLIESILTLQIDKFKKLNSSESTRASAKFDTATADVEKYNRQKESVAAVLTQLEKENTDAIHELEADVIKLTDEIANFNLDIKSSNATISPLEESIAEYRKSLTDLQVLQDTKAKLIASSSRVTEIPALKSTIQADKDSISASQPKYIESVSRRDELVSGNLFSGRDVIRSKINQINIEIGGLNSEVTNGNNNMTKIIADEKALIVGVPCHTCGKPSTDDDIGLLRDSLRDSYKSIRTELNTKNARLTELNATIVTLNESDNEKVKYQDEHTQLCKVIQEIDYTNKNMQSNITNNEATINSINSGLTGLLSEFKIDSIDGVSDYISNLDLAINMVNVVGINANLSDAQSQLGAVHESVRQITSKVVSLNLNLNALNVKIESKKKVSADNSIALTRTQLDDATADLDRAHDRVKKYSDILSVVKFIDKMYSDGGIKKYILSTFVPNLNTVIAHNINLFSLPFSVEFDEALDYKFTSNLGMSQVYEGLSQGQKRKLNFAISMAFTDFVALIADFRINTMFLDEVLDISTDEEALGDMIQLLRNKLTDVPGIYLMSHRGEVFDDYWDHVLQVSHDGSYSSIESIY
jgi:DNA repair exonuclease SbcCD ATPase subunit